MVRVAQLDYFWGGNWAEAGAMRCLIVTLELFIRWIRVDQTQDKCMVGEKRIIPLMLIQGSTTFGEK